MKMKSIDFPYPAFTPVILFDRSLWRKFVSLFKVVLS